MIQTYSPMPALPRNWLVLRIIERKLPEVPQSPHMPLVASPVQPQGTKVPPGACAGRSAACRSCCTASPPPGGSAPAARPPWKAAWPSRGKGWTGSLGGGGCTPRPMGCSGVLVTRDATWHLEKSDAKKHKKKQKTKGKCKIL